MRPDYCPCRTDELDPVCPACGATVEGTDPVGGVCQARYGARPEPLVHLVLIDKRTGEIVGETR